MERGRQNSGLCTMMIQEKRFGDEYFSERSKYVKVIKLARKYLGITFIPGSIEFLREGIRANGRALNALDARVTK